ncbi:MAG: 30S ribosomal protein S1 [Bdellovibrionaceae bacterium]|nr:30S ribosomal protein S1 [Pseudobdellovibrionaceae bacterium]
MSLFMNEVKNKNKKSKAEVLALLDSLDKEIPSNLGLNSSESDEGEEFKKLFENTIKTQEFKIGQIVQGTIVKITANHVIIDINYKSEGIISRSEFSQINDSENELEVGKKIEVYIEKIEDKNGVVILSRDKANIKKVWQNIIKVHENNEVIKGKVVATVKGGLSVDVGIKAFLPGSQLDLRPVKNLEAFVGETLDFKIIKINHKRGNIILSRRVILEKERANLPETSEIKEGSIVSGFVKNLTAYGAFIDLGDRDGLIHITDMSWSRIEHPNQILKVGQKLDLKVLKFDSEKNRVSLGLKQMSEEKWEESVSKYQEGQVIKAKVSSFIDYGVFVMLDEGVEGLVHVNELSWNRKSKPAHQMLKLGQEIEVKILEIKKASRKLSLSIKQTKENPWLKLKDQFQVGQEGDFEIVAISDFGLFVKVTEEIDGLIRSVDLSWTENIKPTEKYKVGDKVKAQILDIDILNEKFSLGIKQTKENPWSILEEKYPIGSSHEVEVIRIVDFGAFVKIEKNIEGLIHISELSKKRVDKVEDVVKVGDKVKAEILNIDKSAKKIGLSIRLLESKANTSSANLKNSEVKEKPPRVMENFFAKALKKSMKLSNTEAEVKKPLNESSNPSDSEK